MEALLILALILAAAGYGLPVWIAIARGHPWAWSIFVLAILGGWTGLAWLFALAWAVGPIARPRAPMMDAAPRSIAAPAPPRPVPAGPNVVRLADHRPERP